MSPSLSSSTSPFFASRSLTEPSLPPSLSSKSPNTPPAPPPASPAPPAPLHPDEARYYGPDEKLVLSFDIGNSFSSVSLTHLHWGVAPLSPSASPPALRTVLTYPFSTPALTPVPSRMPSVMMFDAGGSVRAIGAECLREETKRRAKDEGWTTVKGWKEQVRSSPEELEVAKKKTKEEEKKRVPRKRISGGLIAPPLASTTPLRPSSFRSSTTAPSTASLASSEDLLDAVAVRSSIYSVPVSVDGGSGALEGIGRSSKLKKPKEEEKEKRLHRGPKLSTIYGEFLKHLIACARAWFSETTPNGASTFLRLWSTAVFIVAIPADFTAADQDLIRQGLEEVHVLPTRFELGRLVFVKEGAAITHFAKRHTREPEQSWLRDSSSFVLCDAAEYGVSIVGYTVAAPSPSLKLSTYSPLTRLASPFSGSHAVLTAFSSFLTARLAKTKFSKSPLFHAHLLSEFKSKVLKSFTGLEKEEVRLRVQPEGGGAGEGRDPKAEKWIDAGARIRDAWMMVKVREVEECFRPAVDAIVVKLSSTIPRGGAKYILLTGGFGESPYLIRRLRETFAPSGISLIIPDLPPSSAVSEGALALFLSTLLASPRRTRFALGVKAAVDWRTTQLRGSARREVFEGSGGGRLVLGRFGEVVPSDAPLDPARLWRKRYHFNYRLAAQDPTFQTTLFAHDPSRRGTDSIESFEDGLDEGWMTGLDGKLLPTFLPVCDVSANLDSLVALSPIHGERGSEFVQLEVELVVYVGETSLEAVVVWEEDGTEVRVPPSKIEQQYF